ncbi:hypothetical protein DH2020_042985 [Rehmannia glutinosa]|uniref:Uncharacterized protein n=1 Tax=Rehmannia glutinosa TaxID=99300 RepID=A0ABR0ULV0_REHGL
MEKNQIIAGKKKEPNYRGIKAMPFVIGNEAFEKLGTIGTSSNLLVYLTTVFNMKSITATNVINTFNGTCNVGTLLGAFMSDTYLGRYRTIGIASISSFLGMLVLTLTAAFPKLHPPTCGSEEIICEGPSPGQLTFLFAGFVFLVIGASGIRPCNLAFGADQFNPNTDSGRRDDINSDGSAADPWKLRSLQQVEEVKCVVRVIPVWISGIIYYIVLAIMQNYVVFQAIQANRSLGRGNFKIPAASYNVYTMITLTIWIPIYDRIIVPFLRKITGKEEGITILQRVGIGFLFGILTMIISGLVEKHRRIVAFTRPTLGLVARKGAVSSMSGNWLIPQLVIGGLSEGFAIIGLVELFYKQFPENMRSLGPSFLISGFALSSYLSSVLISVVHQTTKIGDGSNWLAEDLNQGRLDYFYYLIAGLEIVNLGYFLVCAKWYKYRSTDNSSPMDVAKEGRCSARRTLPGAAALRQGGRCSARRTLPGAAALSFIHHLT